MEENHFKPEDETFILSMLISKSYSVDKLVKFYSILLINVRENGIVETVDAFNNVPMEGLDERDAYEYMTSRARKSSYSIVDLRKRPSLLFTPPPHYILSVQTVKHRYAILRELREEVESWEELSNFFNFFFLGLLEENTITGEYIIERIYARKREREKSREYIDLLKQYGLEEHSTIEMNGKEMHMFSNSQTNDIIQNAIQELKNKKGGKKNRKTRKKR